MKQYYSVAGIAELCGLFGKSRQAFYDHNWRQQDQQLQEGVILDLVRELRRPLPKLGGIKLHGMLKEPLTAHGITIGRDSFFTLLRNNDLLIKRKKRYTRTTFSNHPYKKWPDLIKGFQITAPDQLWVSDITYLRTEHQFIYLALITDAYSRKIVGYHLSQFLKAQGCIIALNKAITSLSTDPAGNLIHHSDRGVQYCCEPYVTILQSHKINISMTQTGSPYDNAIAERVNGILKTELGLGQIFKTYTTAVACLPAAIDTYNRLRPHMSCGYLTPEQAHHKNGPLEKKWKNAPKTRL